MAHTGHRHTAHNAPTSPRRVRLAVVAVLAPLMVATVVALVVLWPRTRPPVDTSGQNDRYTGTVTEVHERPCQPDEVVQTPTGLTTSRCGTVKVRLDDGRLVESAMPDGPGAPTVRPGEDVVLLAVTDLEDPSRILYSIIDHQRGFPLLWLALLAAAAIVGFARWRGLAALVGLGVSFAVLLFFVLPAIMTGKPPLIVAVTGAAAIMFAVLYLTHGVSVQTSVAVMGTLASLVLTGVLGSVAAASTYLTGYGGEEAFTLATFYQNVDLHGLLLAGIIIGSLGVLDDVTVTQAATVAELAEANPTMSRLRLYLAAARVGRAHIASVVNTIVLAYAGASLPVLLLISASGRGVAETLGTEFVAQEIVRSIVATIGLVAAVPITTALAALVAADRVPRAATPPPSPAVSRQRGDSPWDERADDWPASNTWR
ncbi:MAG TPA: YibE/F family protein [Micromonosporaceae bacterium]|nr:YibE/F family protein [Micromonosporaceae bacterium]